MTITQITWDEIYKIWKNELWPGRTSSIEPNSAMIFNKPGFYDIANMKTPATFLGIIIESTILGVTSGHSCSDNSYRIRGTWVHPSLRGTGVAHALVEQIVKQGINEKTNFAWTIPRVGASVKMFSKLGFEVVSEIHTTETAENVYSQLHYSNFHIPSVRPAGIFD